MPLTPEQKAFLRMQRWRNNELHESEREAHDRAFRPGTAPGTLRVQTYALSPAERRDYQAAARSVSDERCADPKRGDAKPIRLRSAARRAAEAREEAQRAKRRTAKPLNMGPAKPRYDPWAQTDTYRSNTTLRPVLRKPRPYGA